MGVGGGLRKARRGGARCGCGPPWTRAGGRLHNYQMNNRATRIEATLQAAFPGGHVTVVDDSHRHAGHAGAAPGGETHYTVTLVAPGFVGQGRLARSRAVHAALAAEFAQGLHALALVLRAPGEAEAHG